MALYYITIRSVDSGGRTQLSIVSAGSWTLTQTGRFRFRKLPGGPAAEVKLAELAFQGPDLIFERNTYDGSPFEIEVGLTTDLPEAIIASYKAAQAGTIEVRATGDAFTHGTQPNGTRFRLPLPVGKRQESESPLQLQGPEA
jgi:hypothetical protein